MKSYFVFVLALLLASASNVSAEVSMDWGSVATECRYGDAYGSHKVVVSSHRIESTGQSWLNVNELTKYSGPLTVEDWDHESWTVAWATYAGGASPPRGSILSSSGGSRVVLAGISNPACAAQQAVYYHPSPAINDPTTYQIEGGQILFGGWSCGENWSSPCRYGVYRLVCQEDESEYDACHSFLTHGIEFPTINGVDTWVQDLTAQPHLPVYAFRRLEGDQGSVYFVASDGEAYQVPLPDVAVSGLGVGPDQEIKIEVRESGLAVYWPNQGKGIMWERGSSHVNILAKDSTTIVID